MSLRTVTIRTTAGGLFLTTTMPVLLFFGGFLRSSGIIASISIAMLLWLFSAPPLIISFLVAKKLKYGMPAIVILLTTIAYCILYVYGWCVQWFMTSRDTGIWALGILALPVMFLAWCLALFLDYYVKKTSDPGDSTEYRLNGVARSADET